MLHDLFAFVMCFGTSELYTLFYSENNSLQCVCEVGCLSEDSCSDKSHSHSASDRGVTNLTYLDREHSKGCKARGQAIDRQQPHICSYKF